MQTLETSCLSIYICKKYLTLLVFFVPSCLFLRYKYICIDGHGRYNFYQEAYKCGATVANRAVAPKNEMFLRHDVSLLAGDLNENEITTLCVAKINVNDQGSKERTFYQDYSMFK